MHLFLQEAFVYSTSDIKKGIAVEMDGNPYIVVDFQFVNPGKGSAFYRTRLKNLLTGAVLDRTFKSGEKLAEADIEERDMEYIFHTDTAYAFMDTENYEQIEIPQERIGDDAGYLLENTVVKVLYYNNEATSITLPNFIEVEIAETGPSDKGNTVTTSYKPATLASGGTVQVPMFVKNGDIIKVDTRDKSYVERVS